MKKTKWIVLVGVLCLILVAIIIKVYVTNANLDLRTEPLDVLMTKVYARIPIWKLPTSLINIVVTKDNAEYYLGTSEIEFEEALASESMMSSVAHSVVLLRVKNDADIEATKNAIKKNINPRKWISVGVDDDEVIVKSRGNLIILIMSSPLGDTIEENFDNL